MPTNAHATQTNNRTLVIIVAPRLLFQIGIIRDDIGGQVGSHGVYR